MQASVDSEVIRQWWEARPEANVILVTGRVFDVLDVPAVAGATVLARMAAAGVETGPVAVQGAERMHFYVSDQGRAGRRGRVVVVRPRLLAGHVHPDRGAALALPGQLRARPALQVRHRPGRTLGAGARGASGAQPLPDALRLLEFLVDAC